MTSKKLTASTTAEFDSKATVGDKLWDDEVKGFHILKIASGCSFRIFYRTQVGKQRVTTLGRLGSITADQARKEAKKVTGKVATGEDVSANKMEERKQEKHQATQTLGAFIDGPYTAYQARKKSGQETLSMLNRHFGDWRIKRMTTISTGDIRRWHLSMEAKGLKFPTIERTYSALKTCLNTAVKLESIESHKLMGHQLDRPSFLQDDLVSSAPKRRYLTDDETAAFFDGLEAYQEEKRRSRRNSRAHGKAHLPDLDLVEFVDHVKPWFLTMYYTGFRPGDLFGLRWEHINLDFRTITKVIEKTAHHEGQMWSFPMSQTLTDILTTWFNQSGKPKSGYVFTSKRTGVRMDKTSSQKPWHKIRKLGGLPEDLQLYTLRHNFASQLILSGADLLTVSKLMAHKDIQTTIKHYGHIKPGQARDYVDQFANREIEPNPLKQNIL